MNTVNEILNSVDKKVVITAAVVGGLLIYASNHRVPVFGNYVRSTIG